ncbi:MAG: hypothetical protein GY925_14490 [Actinomycetia bacterium]|nr:hypothetical protein [Actinomycetes bacterium]
MSASSRRIDGLQTRFGHEGIVANAGVIASAAVMVCLDLEALLNTWVVAGSSRAGVT